MSNCSTIADVLRDRAERGLADLLLSVYDAGYCAGAQLPLETPLHTGLAALLTTLAERHRAEILALRGWVDPPRDLDELPGWLLSLSQQADVIEPPAVEGWPV